MSETEKYLTITETADIYRVCKQTLYNYINQKRIPYYKLGNRVLFKKSELDKYLVFVPALRKASNQ